MKNNHFEYNKKCLKFSLNKSINENTIGIIIQNFSTIHNNSKNNSTKLHTKEHLFLMGFNAFQINRFFKPTEDRQWEIKNLIIFNGEVIESIEELCKILDIKYYRKAS